MQHWPAYLAAVPVSLLRLIAAANRISLPRRSDPAARLSLVRRSLCRPATVRAAYFALSPEDQAAAQALCAAPRCLSPAAVVAMLGPIRPLAELRHDRAPRSPAERLLLLGWLLPRPARRNHPPRYVVPPELRDWLPRPLPSATRPPLAAAEQPPCATPLALRAASALLAAAALEPLPLRHDGCLTTTALHRLRPLLADLIPEQSDALTAWLTPLLIDLDLLAPHGAAAIPSSAAARFLAAPPERRLQHLRTAWTNAPRAEPTLLPHHASQHALDWASLRRRLVIWAEASAPLDHLEPTAAFDALTAAFGPLADGFTHPYRHGSRPPWNQRTATAVWERALRGPLAWLGLVAPISAAAQPDAMVATPAGDRDAPGVAQALNLPEQVAQATAQPDGPNTANAPSAVWCYGEPGTLQIVPENPGAELLALAPFALTIVGDATSLTARLTQATVARAAGRGHDPARLRAALERQAGPIPPEWEEVLAPAGVVRLLQRTVVLTDQPAALQGALKRRSVRRLVEAVLAPGVALAAPGREKALAAKLAQHGHVVTGQPSTEPKPTAPAELTHAEVAALLVASAHYRAVAPPDAPPAPNDALTERLRASLPPRLAAATDAAIEALLKPEAPVPSSTIPQNQQPGPHPSIVDLLWRLREAIRRREAVTISYQGANELAPQTRTIRPLYLERHGAVWHLTAYCLLARAERTFRLDRVLALGEATEVEVRPRAQASAPKRRGRGAPRRSALRVGFFAGSPAPPPGSPLVGVWLEEDPWERGTQERRCADGGSDEVVRRLGGDLADAVDDDAPDGGCVEWIAADAVGCAIDDCCQLGGERHQLLPAERALEDAPLHGPPVALEQLHNPRAPLVVDDIVADQREHGLSWLRSAGDDERSIEARPGPTANSP